MPDVSQKWLRVIGIGEDGVSGLAPDAKMLLDEAETVIGGERHLNMLPDGWEGERIVWPAPIREAIPQILGWRGQKVAVMASGDPLCYGIAAKLLRHMPLEEMWIKPSLSTFTLACSRVGWSLPDIETLTIHGRPVEMLHPFVQPGAKLLVLSEGARSPRQAAELLTARGFGKSRITVLEHLGGTEERLFSGHAETWEQPEGAALNAMAIECLPDKNARLLTRVPGLPDAAFMHDGQLTKREVRAAALSRLMPVVDQVLWDVGAGCGSVAIEWMRVHHRCRAVAIEKSESRVKLIEQNALELGVPMLQIVSGTAPGALIDLPAPDAVFIGGGLSSADLLEECWKALNPGGRLVANAVTIAAEQLLLEWQKENGGDLIRISVSRAEPIGSFQGWRPLRPVTQLAAVKCY